MFFHSLGKKTDEQLMHMLATGNQRAFTELYHRYSKPLVRYFFRMLWKDKSKAQDFLHDLFVKIVEHPEYFNPSRKFSTWVYSVAHNMCKNEYRKQAFRDKANLQMTSVKLFILPDELEEKTFADEVEIAINQLDEDDKSLFALRYESEISIEEISLMLECPVGTVKSRLFYLKRKIAEMLTKKKLEIVKYGME